MKLKPADGRAVRDPVKGQLLPAEGAEVELNAFWRRRLKDGDVEEVTATTTATATTAAASTTTAAASTTTATAATSTASATATATADTTASTEATS